MLPIPNNPDPDLVRRTRQGDRDAFLELVRRHAAAVRAIVEARIPGSPRVDEETVGAFARMLRTLFVVRDLTWFHLFAIRTTQAHLDARRYSAEDPGPDAPAWLRRLTLGQRESLFFATRAAPAACAPAIEYLGISQQAYEARTERARRLQAKAQEWEDAGLPPPPSPQMAAQVAAAVDETLGPRRAISAPGSRLPRLPLPLAFLLAIGIAGVAAALLFRPE